MEGCETGVLTKTRCGTKEGDPDVEVYASCIILPLEKERELESWKKLHVGGIEGISCQHFPVMMTNLLPEHWEWQEDRAAW